MDRIGSDWFETGTVGGNGQQNVRNNRQVVVVVVGVFLVLRISPVVHHQKIIKAQLNVGLAVLLVVAH